MTAGKDVSYWTLIADAARREPNRALLADEHGRSLTARQLHDAVCATAAAFAERGIGAATVVSWQLPTTLETTVVMAALARLGAVQNPIIPILREHEVGFITGQLATEFLVVPGVWRGFDHGGLARALSSERGFEVITVDLATPPVAGELRLPCATIDALTPGPRNLRTARHRHAWGLTEFSVATSPSLTAAPEVLDHTVGAPVPRVSVRVVDNREIELPVGREGELRLKGPQCFLGHADATLDADAFDNDGWLRTGDLGLIDANGNVRVTGRIKDAIIRNAENVSALEIENVLATHPAVADVAVIGVPDPSVGERVCAVVVPTSVDGVSLESLVQHCRSRGLSRYKYPERLVIVDTLPRNQFGKVIKKDLRQAFG